MTSADRNLTTSITALAQDPLLFDQVGVAAITQLYIPARDLEPGSQLNCFYVVENDAALDKFIFLQAKFKDLGTELNDPKLSKSKLSDLPLLRRRACFTLFW